MQIHHRPGTLTGLTDPRLLAARSGLRDVLVEGDTVVLAFGTSLPMGKTEENPYHLGDKGELHEHFQFGTGTFDPLLEAYWTVPVGDALRIDGYAIGRVSLYENFKGYRGPVELTIGLNGTVQVSERLSVQTGATVFHQGYAHWDGERDINSGVTATSALVGASWHVESGLLFHAGLRLPLAQHVLSSEGDTFELGPSVMMSASMAF